MSVVAGTGHRPDKLGGYGDDVLQQLYRLALRKLREIEPSKVISGMALGWDTALAMAALKLDIPLVAAVPFAGQESRWPQRSQERFRAICRAATTVHVVSPGGYSGAKMQARNEWMVDRCDVLLALWNGTAGGTANCVAYAQRRQDATGLFPPVAILNVWEEWAARPGKPGC